ncbi:MAG: VacJ family lipoprotein [Rickettsiales bacterium]|nr:VacJ family lipoprotein [Rickettsiales bacterium]
MHYVYSNTVETGFGRFRHLLRTGCASACLLIAAACSSESSAPSDPADPLESFNRAMFSFNEGVDTVLLRPVARGYVYAVPQYGRQRVSNVLNNLRMPVVFLNSVLQLDAQNAFSSFWSFALNSTVGIGGIFDVTEQAQLTVRDEDFDQTLGYYGVGTGAYVVLPILGPGSVRGIGGTAVDWVSDPFNYVDDTFVTARTITSAVDARASVLPVTDEIYKNSIDPYATIRSAYLQRRAALVENRAGRISGGGMTTGPINLKGSHDDHPNADTATDE